MNNGGAVFSDARFALRLVRRSPRFFLLLGLVLSGGVGVTTAMFGAAQALVLRPLPYSNAEELVTVRTRPSEGQERPLSYPQFLDWKARATTLAQLAVVKNSLFAVASEGKPPEIVNGTDVSGDFFPMLGVRPLLGRLLVPEDDQVGRPRIVVISAELWRRRFDSDPQIIGREILLDAREHLVVGVAPERFVLSFPGANGAHLWMPSTVGSGEWARSSLDWYQWHALGRRRSGVTRPALEQELSGFAASAANPAAAQPPRVVATDLQEAVTADERARLPLRLGAMALVFLLACSNVSSLLLTRAHVRRGEFAARAALGATPGRIARQVLTETFVWFSLAVPLSLFVAYATLSWLRSDGMGAVSALAWVNIEFDVSTFAIAFALTLLGGIGAGLAPALMASRCRIHATLVESGTGASTSPSVSRLSGALVVAQVALAFALLTVSALCATSLARLLATPPGFQASGLVFLRLVGLEGHYSNPRDRQVFYDQVRSEVLTIPGVQDLAANEAMPFAGYHAETGFEIAGRPARSPGGLLVASRNVITPNYLETMQIAVVAGRAFAETDSEQAPPVMLINRRLAEAYFPGQDPIGQRLRHPSHDKGKFREIVGVVENTLRHALGAPVIAETYTPRKQALGGYPGLIIRTQDPERLIRSLPERLAALEPGIAGLATRIEDRMRGSLQALISMVELFHVAAAVALLVATFGVYALVAQVTASRTREIGIRIALGSPPSRVIWIVVRAGLAWLLFGVGVGSALALAFGRFLMPSWVDFPIFELRVWLVASLVVVGAGLAAVLLVARRVLKVFPAVALRYE